jgi:predicted metal-dependent HD superfamily phosphohydrolase
MAADLASRWPLAGGRSVRDALLAAYAESRRGYHGTRHLTDVLDRLDELGADEATRLAAWFHDGVYDGAPDDEERSAVWAASALAGLLPAPAVAEVARLVRLTATHDPQPDDTRGAALCDADLAILAAPPQRYAEYAAGVRRDFAHVTDADFAAGRAAVLRDLAGRDPLFHTAYGQEHAARANLARELAELG